MSAQQDVTPPVLLDFSFIPAAFDTGSAAVEVTFCVTAEDDLSGFGFVNGFVSVYMNGPAGLNLGSTIGSGGGIFVSGCQTSTVPQFFPYGLYQLTVEMGDAVGNRSTYNAGGPRDLCVVGPCTVENRPSPGLPDTDLDGFPDDSDNCPDDPNPMQEDTDLDLIGDVCDPFPLDRDNEKAQCFEDLDQALMELVECQATVRVCSGEVVCFGLHDQTGHDPATNGTELVFRSASPPTIVSNLRGTIATGAQPDINEHGEIVYVAEDPSGVDQVFSTTRGQLTFVTNQAGASNPAINGFGEVLYAARDQSNHSQLFSTERGQLTNFDGATQSFDGELAFDDAGRAVFTVSEPDGRTNLWEIDPTAGLRPITFFDSPLQARQPTLAARTGELVYLINDRSPPGDDGQLVSERDGVILTGVNTQGLDRGTFPDLGPDGTLVFLGNDGTKVCPALAIRPSDNQGGQCSMPLVTCVPEPAVSLMLPAGAVVLSGFAMRRSR